VSKTKMFSTFLLSALWLLALMTLVPAPTMAAAAPPPTIDSGDTAWILTSSALVLMMTVPGLFLFYGGLVRGKNVLATIMHTFRWHRW
jgi:Amt family ammonium transporter